MRTADGEEYQWNKVTSTVYNLIIGKLYVDHGGIMRVRNMGTGLVARMQFKEQKLIANRNPHQARDACTAWQPCHGRQRPMVAVCRPIQLQRPRLQQRWGAASGNLSDAGHAHCD